MTKKEKPEKPKPRRCKCGELAVVVHVRGKKMVSCSNPERCFGNFRTQWRKSVDGAIAEWNVLMERG